MLIFNEEGWERMPAELVKNYSLKVSKTFVEKHGRAKIKEVGRKAIINLRDAQGCVKSFRDERKREIKADISVLQKLHAVADSRELSITSLVRLSLHSHLLNAVKPVKTKMITKSSITIHLSPFEEKLLTQWSQTTGGTRPNYLSTLAAVLEPQKEPDLVNLRPRLNVPIYPSATLLENFLHTVNVYGFNGGVFIRQILAFLDRPFNPKRVEDRYLDWLTQGYASTLKAS